jgi:DNA repair exonuclease SbcCD ATPase subunit
MKSSRGLLFAQRLNELNSQLSQLEELRAQIKEAEQRVSGAPTLRSAKKSEVSRRSISVLTLVTGRAASMRRTS